MASLLIIGGSGFFGKSILDAYQRGLLAKWEINQIFILSRSASSLKLDHADLISESVCLIDEDISSCNYLPYADYVIHAAASTDARKYLIESKIEQENILAAIKNYCRLAKKHHQKSKIVYVSSGAVYGPQPGELIEIPEDFTLQSSLETMPANKIGYAAAKRKSEKMILELAQRGINVSIARCFAFVGKYLPLDQHFAIGNFIGNGLKRESIKVFAKNKVYRSYLYADDLVEWLLSIATLSSVECPIFNVGSDEAIGIHDLATIVSRLMNVDVVHSELNSQCIDRYVPSVYRARQFNMLIKYPLDNALQETIRALLTSMNKK